MTRVSMIRSSVGRHGRVVTEVEAQPVRGHQAPRLLDVGSENLAKGRIEEMCSGVVPPDGRAPCRLHGCAQGLSDLESA